MMTILGALAAALLADSPTPAHRPFAATYDGEAPIVIEGVVAAIDWTRPNIRLHVADLGTRRPWIVEIGSPDEMRRAGMAAAMGQDVVVRAYLAKDKRCRPECLAAGRDVTLKDGNKIRIGAAGPATAP